MSYRTRRQLLKLAIFAGFCLTLFLAVDPDVALRRLGLSFTGSTDYARPLFAGINAAILALLASAGTFRLVSDRAPRPQIGLRTLPRLSVGAQEPYRSLIVYTQFPSFSNQGGVLAHVEKAVVLANYKLVLASSFADLEQELLHSSVVGLIVDRNFSDDAQARANRAGVALCTIEQSRSFGSSRIGQRVRLHLGNDTDLMRNIYATALPLAHAYASDVVRAVGFHGTWVTTYGLMSIREDANGRVNGLYWYGRGEIEGDIEIAQDEAAIIMRFDWSQTRNASGVGSRSTGRGVFVLVAGYEVFFGYWYLTANPSSTQLWSGTRLSHDIIVDIRQGGQFASNFGLSQHALTEIVDPGES